MAGKSLNLRAIRAHDDAQVPPRLGLRIVAVFIALEALLLLGLLLMFAPGAGAAPVPVKAEVSVSTSAGYARFVFHFAEDSDAEINLNNGILVIAFKKPVDVSVDRIAVGAPAYVNAARLDPDGMAVRLALGRKVTANSMMAGDRLFVDLLPEGWVGLPPGLPQAVVDELARRAREAERKERQRREEVAQQQPQPLIRVRVGTQPTFTRYVFALPQATAVTTDRAKDRLTVLFDASLRFDLADAQAAPPRSRRARAPRRPRCASSSRTARTSAPSARTIISSSTCWRPKPRTWRPTWRSKRSPLRPRRFRPPSPGSPPTGRRGRTPCRRRRPQPRHRPLSPPRPRRAPSLSKGSTDRQYRIPRRRRRQPLRRKGRAMRTPRWWSRWCGWATGCA
jgi:hypothetical protein